MSANSHDALRGRMEAGTLTWHGPALMLFARAIFAVAAQAIVAAVYALQSSPTPWSDSTAWLPVYGTLIDAGCLLLLWRLTKREAIGVFDLVSFDRTRLGRDILFGLALIPVSLLFILAGVYSVGWLVYGTLTPPYLYDSLPLPAAIYGTLIWPFIWGLVEQMTYNGYLVSRWQVVCKSTFIAVLVVSLVWSFQHAVMPLRFDAHFVIFRLLSPIPFSFFSTLLYLSIRRLVPFIVGHALRDGAGVVIGVLLPLLK